MESSTMKPFLLWRDDWLLGQVWIDEQHLELCKILNRLHECLNTETEGHSHNNSDQINRHLTHLSMAARRHFKSEEAMMKVHRFSDLANHHREHALLLAELQECIREIGNGNKPFTLKNVTALKYWLIDHVTYSDRLFAEYLETQAETELGGGYVSASA
jgi:hemerythrin